MKFYGLRFSREHATLHVFSSKKERDRWVDAVNYPVPSMGSRAAISSSHTKVQQFYDEEGHFVDHRDPNPIPELKAW